ncbi:DUF2306 domain-containing protein [Nocardioides sp.]|uniref:DUF2306 domain-containing protein n=1 Tax=Nocardioides sp. TaxID=35761 RepID=UPI002B9C4504|nr:DUF2306 domain-containing protein [Nocardioides sp.]HSX65909.1 DUF2306 domain-containing protein [Nocardioides sp.]
MAVDSPRRGAPRQHRAVGLVAYGLIGLIVVLYAPMAIEYMWRFFDADAPELWNHAYAGVVGDAQAYGDGSVYVTRHAEYAEHRGVLLLHTTTGGLAIIGFLAQFSARLRRNRQLHRIVGRITAALVVVSMSGSYAYLLLVGPDGIFDGPGFYLQLWGLATGSLVGTLLAVWAIRAREVLVHQTLMAYAFALLLTAPLLRGLYVVFGLAWADATQELTHLAGSALLATAAPFGAVLASRSFDHRDRTGKSASKTSASAGWRIDAWFAAAAISALVLLAARYRATFDGLDRVTTVSVTAIAIGLALALGSRFSAVRQARSYAAAEWRIHVRAMLAAIPAYLVLWMLYDVPFAAADAFNGAALTAPGMTLSLGLFLVAWRRRRRAGRSPSRSVDADQTGALVGGGR